MDVVGKVEEIIVKIEPFLNAKYIGSDTANQQGQLYTDAADFVFELPDGTRASFCVSGRDCIQYNQALMLEDLIRTKANLAFNSSTP